MSNQSSPPRPHWLRAKAPAGENYEDVLRLVESRKLHTVCQSANCPNIGECWRERTATFMILGGICTRNCRFCAVDHGATSAVDEDEPRRVAEAVAHLNLKHAVITSVTRDDLPDGGAYIFARTIELVREATPKCTVEVLIPDFQGSEEALATVLASAPDVLNHNVETVERLYPLIRPQAIYFRSVDLIRAVRRLSPGTRTKSGLMVGVGETTEELIAVFSDLRDADCNFLTVGQYLAPSSHHAPIERYYTPEEFDDLKARALAMGFAHVESAPLVRSSYHAAQSM